MALEVPYRSIPDMLLRRVEATPDGKAFGGPNADDSGIDWLTWAQVGDRAKAIAAGLVELGVGVEDRVSIISNTRLEWVLADLGINLAGAATTTVYPTTEPEDAAYIVADSDSKVVVAENAKQAMKLAGSDNAVTHVVLIEGMADAGAQPPQLTLAELEERGQARLAGEPGLIERIAEGLTLDNLATLIYTSGTTGRPKGVQLTHACWVWEGVAQGGLGLFEPDDLQFLWLPLAHAFGKCLTCGVIHVGAPTYVDGRVDKLVELLPMVRPTLMCAAPRIFEKVYNKTVTTAMSGGGVKAKIFQWAVRTGKAKVALEQAGKPVPGGLKAKYAVAERLVFSKLQQRLGGKLRLLVSGAAPLSRDIAEFFAAANLPIMEGYGLTETSAAIYVNRLGRLKIGSVGEALGDLECRLDHDGEVLVKGTPVMRGYHNLPKETAEAFTEDGFLRTGDIGELDADGYLRITDRKKDLVKTSGGKYIAPSAIEGQFKAVCPYTSQVVVVGQSRNFVTMLVSLDEDAIASWAAGGPLAGKPYEEIVASPEAEKLVAGFVEELNGKLNRWETIKRFAILPRDLSIEQGELTPSMKIKRRSVEVNFAEQIDKMYEGSLAKM
ncbi:long-chain fatty acid--CoA ligase [Actinoplanes sp. N902-109]|uniref:AMP-dependent synthetase/ligase n=1 Tax=Actinoplanes sp. (strain N902-109) TaxID=649831 RepID=UPI00032967E1|nr:long-chain fatty acid--CoA ligase [Actinoplanes sp. N902-109]AGL15562.1 amp-dependent synthetase and ligase [Actinoplanes sp. N902-109]